MKPSAATSSSAQKNAEKSFLSTRYRVQHNKTPPENAIFFLGAYLAHYLSSKHLCAIESAARHHPNRPIVLAVFDRWFIIPKPAVEVLSKYEHFQLIHLNVTDWGMGTPLDLLAKEGLLEDGDVEDVSATEVLSCMTLYKHGGVYLEGDTIVMKPFDSLGRNAIGLAGNVSLSAAASGSVMAFQKGHPVMANCVRESLGRFNGLSWQENGPVMPMVVNKWCGLPENATNLVPGTCRGVNILAPRAFYPVPKSKWKYLFKDNETTTKKILTVAQNSFAIHYWNNLSVSVAIKSRSNQPLATLARMHCPETVAAYPKTLWSEFTGLW